MEHLVIPTRDYLFAPSIADIIQAVNFIHSESCLCSLFIYSFLLLIIYLLLLQTENALLGKTTYVHCKAGRGRSTVVVLCYLASP